MEETTRNDRTLRLPIDINGREVQIGDKVCGFGFITFQDGFKIDRRPEVTVRVWNGRLYYGMLSAVSFDKFVIMKQKNLSP